MLEKSFSQLYFLKLVGNEPKKYVYMRITVDRHSVELSTKERWWEDRWDQEKGRATGTKQDAQEINFFLDVLQNKVFQARQKLIEDDEIITAELIRDMIQGKYARKTVLDVFRVHNEQMEALIGKDFSKATHIRYQTSYGHTQAFIQWQYQQDDFPIRKLDNYFIEQYAFWFKTVRNCSHNTTMKYLKNFKKVVLLCVKNKWLASDPFPDFKMSVKDVPREALTDIELDKIIRKDFKNERLNSVRDIFVFSCYTGLAYADVKKLRRSEIQQGIDGEQWIFTPRQKTETPCPIPLLPVALQLIKKYADHPKCVNQDLVLPVLSNQKMNAYLKEIADISGIKKLLTYHLARHTFATTITLSNGVPIETVSKMLGHTTLKQTQHYAKVVHTKISVDMASIREKYSTGNVEPIEEECTVVGTEPEKNAGKAKPLYNYVLVA